MMKERRRKHLGGLREITAGCNLFLTNERLSFFSLYAQRLKSIALVSIFFQENIP